MYGFYFIYVLDVVDFLYYYYYSFVNMFIFCLMTYNMNYCKMYMGFFLCIFCIYVFWYAYFVKSCIYLCNNYCYGLF